MNRTYSKTRAAFKHANEVTPLGVNSNFRYAGEDTMVIERGEGPYVWDMDGNRYIDYRLAYGPVILGHGDKRVSDRIIQQLGRGNLYAHTHPLEIEVAERIVRLCPGVDKVRLSNSGTEATMHAARLARAYTNRDAIIKFEGAYHGNHDYVLWSTANMPIGSGGSPRSPVAVAQSSGIPYEIRGMVYVARFNDFEGMERLVKDKGGEAAAMVIEPMMGNAACLMPEPGYLEYLRKLCDDFGILLVFDEVKTGFRIANGGATEHFGVKADLYTFAKALGNGYPVAAIGGRKEVMDTIAFGQVVHGGTYCGNAVGTAAAVAVLEALEKENVLANMAGRGKRLMKGIDDILTEHGLPHFMSGHPNMFGLMFEPKTEKPKEFRDVIKGNFRMFDLFGSYLRDMGVDVEGDFREPWFMSDAHTDSVIDETLNIVNDAAKLVKQNYVP
ncbi:MAG: aspartate aminotransferase family protein [Chloroflexi bacterium]|nr:aspartate aminotransferase family protein [Chloroflexota bacterium]